MLIAGGSGSGKTTLLNTLSRFIPEEERVVTIEDTPSCNCSSRTWCAWKRGR
jgi:pilus assembly protein CpaF